MIEHYPLDQLYALPHRLRDQRGRWALITSDHLCEDEALHVLDRLAAWGLEARISPEHRWKTLARWPVEIMA